MVVAAAVAVAAAAAAAVAAAAGVDRPVYIRVRYLKSIQFKLHATTEFV